MRTFSGRVFTFAAPWRCAALSLIAALAGCAFVGDAQQQAQGAAAPQPLQLTMLLDVDPAADAIWESNGSTVTAQGQAEIQPASDAEWETLRRHAQLLIKASESLARPELRVAIAGAVTEGTGTPGVRDADQIQAAIAADRPAFLAQVAELRRGAELALKAIDKKDTAALFEAGGVFYESCANCHSRFWAAPDERRPALPRNINLAPLH